MFDQDDCPVNQYSDKYPLSQKSFAILFQTKIRNLKMKPQCSGTIMELGSQHHLEFLSLNRATRRRRRRRRRS